MALHTKKAACFAMSGITVVSVFCYRFVRKHPFISSLLCSLGVLYICYPKVFFFLVSSSPVLVSTALLLGTLLSLGQPHIPQIDDLDEEEEDNLEASSKALEDDEDEKKRSINIVDETSGDDDPLLQRTDVNDDASSVATDVPVTNVLRRRFEEGIDDFSARRYIDSETLLGRRTEIVETIEEEEEQSNVEDLDDSDDRIRNETLPESVDFTPTHKREVEEVAAIGDKGSATVVDEFNHIVETNLEKEPENIAHKEEISEKTGEEATLEGLEGHAIEGNKMEAPEREDLAKSIYLSDTETMIERSLEKPMKEIEEEIPLLGYPGSSTPEINEEVLHPRKADIDSSEGTSESQGINDKAEAIVGDEPQAKVSDDVEVENAQKPSLENFFSLELRSSWKRFTQRHSPSDSGSDAAESISSDASLGQLDPMFDEHHPLLAYEGSKASSVSNSTVEEGFHVEDFSPRETVSEGFVAFPDEPQIPSDVHEDEEEEEEEASNDFGFTWTEDDEKNLRDLGLSERERMQQEERLIVNPHVQHPQGAQEENLIDFYSEERVSHIDEENLVEIGIAGETAAKTAVAIKSESVDLQPEGKIGSTSKEIALEMCLNSSNREMPANVHFDSGHEEQTTELQCDQVHKENPNALSEDNSSLDHLDKYMPNDLESPVDQSQPSGDTFLAEARQEMTHVEASSIEEVESAPKGVIVEDVENMLEEIQASFPKDSLQSTETSEVAHLASSTKVQMHEEGVLADISSIQEQSKSHKNTVLDDDLGSSSSSVDETEKESAALQEECGVISPENSGDHNQDVEADNVFPAPVHEIQQESMDNVVEDLSTEEHESRWEENKEASDDLKDSENHSQDVEMKDMLSVPVVEIPRETIDTVAEVHSTEEYDSGEKEGREASDDSSSSASEKIDITAMEVMVDKSAVMDENVKVLSPKVFSESMEMIEPFSQDASLATEVLRDDSTTLVEEAFSENQHEKMEAACNDLSFPASGEFDWATGELAAEESTYKHDAVQVEPLKVEEQPNEKGRAIEEDSSLETETQRAMVSKEEQEPKEEKTETCSNDTSCSAFAETESTSGEFVEGDVVGKHEEINEVPLKISQGSTEIMEAVLGDNLSTAREMDFSAAQGVKLEEHKELSDDLSFSATNIATSDNQGLIMLDVKSKEELESVFEHVVSHELDNKYEGHLVSSETDQESTATIEQGEQNSTLQMHMSRDAFSEDAASEEQPPVPEETKNTSDDSSSSASDISSFERIEELTSLEINSKEQIEAALKEAIAEQVSHKNKEVQFSTRSIPEEEEQQPVPEETANTSDDSSSSASDISSFERIEELTSLEINSKEQIETALKEAIAEEVSHKNKEVQFSPTLYSEKPTETVEPTIVESPPEIDMQRVVSPSAIPSTSLTEEHHAEPEKTVEARNDLNSAEMEVRKRPPSDGGEIQ